MLKSVSIGTLCAVVSVPSSIQRSLQLTVTVIRFAFSQLLSKRIASKFSGHQQVHMELTPWCTSIYKIRETTIQTCCILQANLFFVHKSSLRRTQLLVHLLTCPTRIDFLNFTYIHSSLRISTIQIRYHLWSKLSALEFDQGKYTHSKSHTAAVTSFLCSEWTQRVEDTRKLGECSNSQVSKLANKIVYNVIFGNKLKTVDDNIITDLEDLPVVDDEHLKTCFSSESKFILTKNYDLLVPGLENVLQRFEFGNDKSIPFTFSAKYSKHLLEYRYVAGRMFENWKHISLFLKALFCCSSLTRVGKTATSSTQSQLKVSLHALSCPMIILPQL